MKPQKAGKLLKIKCDVDMVKVKNFLLQSNEKEKFIIDSIDCIVNSKVL